MNVVDLQPQHHETYFKCLEDWSDEIKEAGEHKACWYHKYKERGLRVKVSLDDHGVVTGMIQYLPIEESFAEGKDLYFIMCIWVHGYKEGIGNFQKQGIGTALLEAAEEDVKSLGAKGIVAWGLWIPIWMKASWSILKESRTMLKTRSPSNSACKGTNWSMWKGCFPERCNIPWKPLIKTGAG